MRLLLTGVPGIGKTTVVREVLKNLRELRCAGFYTEEIRERGQRKGFKICTLDGREGVLASIKGKGPQVGRYRVHVEEFEEMVLSLIDPEINPADLYVIDEIGKMELLSPKFRKGVVDLLARPANMLATIAEKGRGFVDQIKGRNDVELLEVTRENRDRLPEELAEKILQGIKL